MALTKIRQGILDECAWGVKNNSTIHYAQVRPTPNSKWKAHTLPISTDCSGSLEAIFYSVGAQDPSGLNYSGQGNTATLYGNAEHLALADLEPGDFIICFKGTETEHVYIVISRLAGGDLKLFSHGQESTPAYENLSAVKGYWDSIGKLAGCRTLPVVEKAPSWVILDGHGHRIAHTNHPAIWATRHPRMFRKKDIVRFKRQ